MQIEDLDITLLVDNEANPGLLSGHGLSLWIETRNHRISFNQLQTPGL